MSFDPRASLQRAVLPSQVPSLVQVVGALGWRRGLGGRDVKRVVVAQGGGRLTGELQLVLHWHLKMRVRLDGIWFSRVLGLV